MIEKIMIKNLYNFGNVLCEVEDLQRFNLFVGKNGSGKSNILRAICNLDVKSTYSKGRYSYLLWNDSIRKTYFPSNNNYDDIHLIIKHLDDEVEFRGHNHVKGDFLGKQGQLISCDNSAEDFELNLRRVENNSAHLKIISFALYYIFGLKFSVKNDGITEWFIRSNGSEGEDGGNGRVRFANWSSGYLRVSNILLEILRCNNRIICLDEPEVHLEARSIRKFFEVLVWLSNYENKKMSQPSTNLYNTIENEWKNWSKTDLNDDVPDIRNRINLKRFNNYQYFFSSHSSVLLNHFLRNQDYCSVYHLNRKLVDDTINNVMGEKGKKIERKTIVGILRKVESIDTSILDNLGVKGSDNLVTEGIIWVEGPSDIIYIRKWLEIYAIENNLPDLVQGEDYQFQMYGGALLNYLCAFDDNHKKSMNKIIDILTISRKAYIVMDSDATLDGMIIQDKSNFKKGKDYFLQKIQEYEDNVDIGVWYERGNTEFKTIEDYLDMPTKKAFYTLKSPKKALFAQKIVSQWTDLRTLIDFPVELQKQIKKMYDVVSNWNI